MISINKVSLCGNLTRDPEIKTTANGKIARLSIATNRRYRDRETNEMKEQVQYHDVVVFQERLVDVIESYCQKGTQVYVEGALEHRSYEDKDNIRRYVTEVVLRSFNSDFQLGSRPGEGRGGDTDRSERGNDRGGGRGNDRDSDRGSRGGRDDRDDRGSRGGGSNRGDDRGSRGGYNDDLDDDIPF